jgi:hypothetical protein
MSAATLFLVVGKSKQWHLPIISAPDKPPGLYKKLVLLQETEPFPRRPS